MTRPDDAGGGEELPGLPGGPLGSSRQQAKRAPPSSSGTRWERDRRWGIVVDAGSSGSRLQVYSWLAHDAARSLRLAGGHSTAVLPKVEKGVEEGDGWTLKVEPGLSSFADNPDGVESYLEPLFAHARSIIPPSQLADTPVYVLATAGMRLVPEQKSDAVLSRACAYIEQKTPFRIRDCEEQVRIISGEEEGIYGWVAINYLMDGFDAHGLADKGQGRHSSTYGFLDMGGASTQIAFEPSTEARHEHADNLLSVNLRLLDGMDVHHPVFVTTWLGYGTNQARERYVDAMVAEYKRKNGPELASSLTSATDDESILETVPDPCLPKDLVLREARHRGYAFQGTGDFRSCMQHAAPLLNSDQDCKDEPCLMGVHVPPIDFKVNHFIGISEYWYSTQDIWSLGGVYDFPTFERSALDYCSQGWQSIIDDHKEGGSRWRTGQKAPDLHRLEMQCFKAAWIVNVLHDGIGVPRLTLDSGGEGGRSNGTEDALFKAGEKGFAEHPPSFQSVDQINNVAVSWTLGRMVLEVTDSIPKSANSPSHDHDDDAGTPVFEWKTGHKSSSWRQRLGSYYGAAQTHSSLVGLLGVIMLALAIWYCSRSSKRPRSWFSLGSARPQRDDYGLVSMEEGGPVPDPGSPASPRKVSSTVSRALLPLRVLASRIAPFSSHRSSSKPVIPLTRPTNSSLRMKPGLSTNKLRHSASSPNLSKSMHSQQQQQNSSIPASTRLPYSTSASPANSSMHVDMPQRSGSGLADFANSAPFTPPARSTSPGWALRMTPGTAAAAANGLPRSSSARVLHRSNTSASDSDGYLSVPVGVSSTAPQVGAGTAWDPSTTSNAGTEMLFMTGSSPTRSRTPEEERPAFRSRQSSYTNLSSLARNRGGHSRQVSTDVH